MKKIGFIGTGIMGAEMIRNLMKSGYEVSIYTRTKSKAKSLISEGALWVDTIPILAKNKDAIITMLGYPSDVDEVYFADYGILTNASPNTYLIDMTTSSPSLARKIFYSAVSKGLFALDAPVSGGKIGAKNATLSIMVGGDKSAYDTCYKLFQSIGKTIAYIGDSGAGQIAKAANQTAIAGCIAGVAEAITLVQNAGLDPKTVLDVISNGAAKSFQMDYNGYAMIQNDMRPSFYIKHYIKDLNIASTTSTEYKINLPILEQVLKLYKKLADDGASELGTQAIIKAYNKEN